MRISIHHPGVLVNLGEPLLGSHGSDSRFGPHGGGPYKPIDMSTVPPLPLHTIEVVDTAGCCTWDPTAMTLKPNGSGKTGTVFINVAARGSKVVTVGQVDVCLDTDDLGISISFTSLPAVPKVSVPLTAEQLEKEYDIKRKPVVAAPAPTGPVNRRVGKPDLRPLPFLERRYSLIDLRGEAAKKAAAEKAAGGSGTPGSTEAPKKLDSMG